MLDIGERLKSYEPLWENWYKDSYIGGGKFGKVYKLRQNFFGETRYSVVKVIPIILEQELNSLSGDKRQFIENRKAQTIGEIKIMYQFKGQSNLVQCLAHNIKDIYDDVGNVIGFDVLIQMDYYTSLPSYLRANGKLVTNDTEMLALQIASGLKAMHDINMLHRDIKIDNIYVDNEKNFLLGDFGISKQDALSSYSTMAGTPPFIAPEVWKVQHTNRRYTKTADIYSFGITLYYLLNDNSLPMVNPGATQNEIDEAIFARLNGKPFAPPKNGSDRLKSIVMKCCEYEPENRFQNMSEVITALNDESYTDPARFVTPQQNDQYATVYAANSRSNASTESYHPDYDYSNMNQGAAIYGTPYNYQSRPRSRQPQPQGYQSAPASIGNNKLLIGIFVLITILIALLIFVILFFGLRDKENSKEDSSETKNTSASVVITPENAEGSNAPTKETTTTATTTSTTTTSTTTKKETTTTTTKATTAKKKEKISVLKQPDKLYGGIEEGDVYTYEGTEYTLYYGPDESKYEKTDIKISTYDIVQEHGRLKDASWLYVSVYGTNEFGWIKNNSLSEFTEYPGMSSITGYLSPGYFGTITKETAFRRGPNAIRDPIPGCNTIKGGATVEVIGSCTGWYYVYYGSYDGWVSSDNVELLGER